MATSVRTAAVAGQFYPHSADTLLADIREYTAPEGNRIRAVGCVVPHAGYIYSGHVAGAVYARLELPTRFIILCPNHTGLGTPLSIMSQGAWLTPLGEAPIDTDLASLLKEECDLLIEDPLAHRNEHAIEVQVPFLQALVPSFTFVPVTVGTSRFDALEQLGRTIGVAIRHESERILVIASSDMNHYESDSVTRIKDRRAIDPILALDPRGLWEAVTRHNITMCGFGPTVAMLTAASELGATEATLIKYATSGDVSGDRDMVVGYAGIAVS
ncbi:MAG TPA: AmmeMemoRadiSam system protein B [Terriglobales bacterium]|nr:AmmeMemoRadiSam system protein B [Terriglobales bacterium]